jgi:hypothetical protein
VAACLSMPAAATETENLGIRILPAPGVVRVDGKFDDWDLSGGVFITGNVEASRDTAAGWLHAMYDRDTLYILVRWHDDTPLNNPGSIAGDAGFAGDSLQLRLITNPDGPGDPVICWLTAWRDRQGRDVIDLAFPKGGGENLKDAKSRGARQAFLENADGTGYVQEIALPWSVLKAGGGIPGPGGRIVMSVELNFGSKTGSRFSFKDIFRPGVTPNRVFTFDAPGCWGFGVLSVIGHVEPQPVRLADGRQFAVRMVGDAPAVDWIGLTDRAAPAGVVSVPLTMPDAGFVSLNILNVDGQVVRQLLSAAFLDKGMHQIPWDGLTNPSQKDVGDPAPPGHYTWKAIWHTGIGLRLVGWADNAGRTPFESPAGGWGGDHGNPSAVDSNLDTAFLGWTASEAGQAVVATDLDGRVKWRHKRGGFGSARLLCVDAGVIFVYDRQLSDNVIYRLDAAAGQYLPWKGRAEAALDVTALLGQAVPGATDAPMLTGMAAADGTLFLGYRDGNVVVAIDAATGQRTRTWAVKAAGDLERGVDGKLYVVSAGRSVLRIDVKNGRTDTVVDGQQNVTALALDAEGAIYVGLGEPTNQVRVFGPDGRLRRTIGQAGGRPLLGPWEPGGLRFIRGLRVDARQQLWVAEDDDRPRRISVWDAHSGRFLREFFGPTDYGATGGAISPQDPLIMVGQGAEWRVNASTGRADCVNVFHRGPMNTARFGVGNNGRLYLAVGGGWIANSVVHIYERLASGPWKLRTTLEPVGDRDRPTGMRVWADANDDGAVQDSEVQGYTLELGGWINGWYMPMTQSLTFYGGVYRIAVSSFTASGAPVYDLTRATRMPAPADVLSRGGTGTLRSAGSEDGRLVIYNGRYGATRSTFECYDIESGSLKWTYPDTYVGVHGGHMAPPPQPGLIRAAYDIVGTARLPDPIGDIFVIPTDKGEWHILTGEGFYLTKLFEGDPMKMRWPEAAVPGAVMDAAPPGVGAEDFGGSISSATDGHLYVQAGKTAFVNLKVVGLDTVKTLGTGSLTLPPAGQVQPPPAVDAPGQPASAARQVTVRKGPVHFTGDVRRDFASAEWLEFSRNPSAGVAATIAYDDTRLYLGWLVSDDTPWVNTATEPAVMYASGDTVDFQLATDPKADATRTEAGPGDLRVSIGNFRGTPTAVLYRRRAADKHPRTFYSGLVREGYVMESVTRLDKASIRVSLDPGGKGYEVEAAIPLSALGVTLSPGLTLKGDFGATHGSKSGSGTVLRTHWSNRATGLVADAVLELKLEPGNWGVLLFR